MANVTKSVLRAMERVAPLRLAETWDNVGLLMEAPFARPKANQIMLTIDLTPAVLEEALSTPTAVIVSYHPPLFRPLASLTLSNPLQASLLTCVASGISIYSPHTALDTVGGGINDWLTQAFTSFWEKSKPDGFTIAPIEPLEDVASPGKGRIVTYHEALPLSNIVTFIKKHLGVAAVQVASTSKDIPMVKSIAMCAGSGGSMLKDVNADVYFTGEMPHHEVLAALAKGTNVILCGHDNTERGYLPILKEKLQANLAHEDHLEVTVSKKDRHPFMISDGKQRVKRRGWRPLHVGETTPGA